MINKNQHNLFLAPRSYRRCVSGAERGASCPQQCCDTACCSSNPEWPSCQRDIQQSHTGEKLLCWVLGLTQLPWLGQGTITSILGFTTEPQNLGVGGKRPEVRTHSQQAFPWTAGRVDGTRAHKHHFCLPVCLCSKIKWPWCVWRHWLPGAERTFPDKEHSLINTHLCERPPDPVRSFTVFEVLQWTRLLFLVLCYCR